jgi:hypothetical protein
VLRCEWLVSEPVGNSGCSDSDFCTAEPAKGKRLSSNYHCVSNGSAACNNSSKSATSIPSA